MTEWKKEISDVFVNLENRRVEIHQSLRALLDELKQEPGIRRIEFDFIDEATLTWKVGINGKEYTITEDEVSTKQKFHGNGFDLQHREIELDIPAALRELLVEKVKSPF